MSNFFLFLLVLLVGVTLYIWSRDRRRARLARVEPSQAKPEGTTTAQGLIDRLVQFARANPRLETGVEHGDLLVSWKLSPVASSSDPESLPQHAHSIELRPRAADRVVHVRYGNGKIEWQEVGAQLVPFVEWQWDMEPDFVSPAPPELSNDEAAGDESYTAAGLVRPIRQVVLDAGWAWQPVLELPVTEAVTERIELSK